MARRPNTTPRRALLAALGAVLLAAGGLFFGVSGLHRPSGHEGPTSTVTATPWVEPSPPGLSGSASPSPTATAPPIVRPDPPPARLPDTVGGEGVNMTLVRAEVDRALGGVEVELVVENDRPDELTFPFDPTTDVTVVDDAGARFSMAWGAYTTEVVVPPRGRTTLFKGFFRGPLDEDRDLIVEVLRVPGVSDARWRLPRRDVGVPRPLQRAEVAGGERVRLRIAEVARAPNGDLVVSIDVANAGERPVDFPFAPFQDLSLDGADGARLAPRWVEYEARVRVAPGEERRLARAAFAVAPHDDGGPLRLVLREAPEVGRVVWEIR